MASKTLTLPETAPRRDKLSTVRAVKLLSLGAAPTFASMAMVTAIADGGSHTMGCAAASHAPALGGMVLMYLLMSIFHLSPWLKLISRWRIGGQPS